MKKYTISENDGNQRLDRFLIKAFPLLTVGTINRALRTKSVRINGKHVVVPGCRLKMGDELSLYIKDELLAQDIDEGNFFNVEGKLNIIYEDANILLVDKPVGLVVHEDNGKTADTLINRILRYLYDKGEYDPFSQLSFVPALCNRIDRNTGGIVIAAKNAEALRIMNQKLRDRELTKLYLCIVRGCPKQKEATVAAYLEKMADENRVVISDKKTPDNLTIMTKYRILDSFGEESLVEVDLLTGRTHQIRAHFAYLGFPLLGDGKYGSNKVNKALGYRTQALYSYKLKFEFTTDGGELEYLNKREFEVKNVWFKDRYFSDKAKFTLGEETKPKAKESKK